MMFVRCALLGLLVGCAEENGFVVTVSPFASRTEIDDLAEFNGGPEAFFTEPLPPETTHFEAYIVPDVDDGSLIDGVELLDRESGALVPLEIEPTDDWHYRIVPEVLTPEVPYRIRFGTEIRTRGGRSNPWAQAISFQLEP